MPFPVRMLINAIIGGSAFALAHHIDNSTLAFLLVFFAGGIAGAISMSGE